MLRSVQELRDLLARNGKIIENQTNILGKGKANHTVSYEFFWKGDDAMFMITTQKTERKCLQDIYNTCIDYITRLYYQQNN